MDSHQRTVVSGIGAVLPGGIGVDPFRRTVLDRRRARLT
jgi:hypothetical protein